MVALKLVYGIEVRQVREHLAESDQVLDLGGLTAHLSSEDSPEVLAVEGGHRYGHRYVVNR